MTYNHDALIGLAAMVNNDAENLGTITDSYHEGNLHYVVIDSSYELAVQSAVVIVDITKGKNYARLEGF